MYGLVLNSQTSENLSHLAQAASPTAANLFCLAHIHVFYPRVSVGSSAAESISTVFLPGRIENDVNPKFLSNSLCFCLLYCYISRYFYLIESLRLLL